MQSNYSTHPKTKQKSIPILAMHRQVGAVRDSVFYKRVQGSRHFLHKPPAIALDVESLAQAEAVSARSVEIHDEETGFTYRATFETIRTHGFRVDRGYGLQMGLEFKWWVVSRDEVDPKQMALPLGV